MCTLTRFLPHKYKRLTNPILTPYFTDCTFSYYLHIQNGIALHFSLVYLNDLKLLYRKIYICMNNGIFFLPPFFFLFFALFKCPAVFFPCSSDDDDDTHSTFYCIYRIAYLKTNNNISFSLFTHIRFSSFLSFHFFVLCFGKEYKKMK